LRPNPNKMRRAFIPIAFPLPLVLGLVLALTGEIAIGASAGADPEDDLKAAAVLSFLRNSQWPATSDGALSVGVAGRASFERSLIRVLEGKWAGNRPIRAVAMKSGDETHCQLLYFATDNAAAIKSMLANTQALTIGETGRFLDYGGAISLSFADGHIGFEADLAAIARSGITISPSLMRLGQLRNGGKERTK
jgi:hypothetical protein